MTVSVLLVSHDGARWLPAVLGALAEQTRKPDRVVAVDTGSQDAGPDLIRQRLGEQALVPAAADASYGAAVATGLASLPPSAASTADDPEWIWLLHDDSAPAPTALEILLATAEQNPSVSALGPKLREWPSLRRLLEVGVTLSGTGRRETGLEPGEYDQGQHDRTRDVLAVNTAGMLVRRDVLEDLGFDGRLPIFNNDIDFGWRAARAGHRTLVVPDAVVFHVEAAHRGVRRTPVTTNSFRRAERRAALYTLLVNCSTLALPFQVVRLFFGSLVRALGFLLVRAPGEALDELAGLSATYLRPDRIVSGRASRRRSATVGAKGVRHLLAPAWVPYRHGLDFVTDLATALAHQAGDVSASRSSRREASETGPVPVEVQNLPADTGLIARLLSSPTAGVFALLTVAALVGARGLIGSGMLSGGALLPAPAGAGGWWRLYVESWHQVGVGSGAPAAPYLLPLAAVGTVLLGKAWLVVDLLFFFVVPLAAFGAYRFLRTLTGSTLVAIWGSTTYGLLPVLGGAVQQGRLGTVAAAVILPWVAHSAWFLGPGRSVDRRWRAAWRTSLWLALLAAFTPIAWVLACILALVALVALVAETLLGRAARARFSTVGPVLVTVAAVPVLLLPWTLLTWGSRGLPSILFEAGLAAPGLSASLGPWDIVLGRPADLGAAPAWLSAGVLLAGLAALVRPDTRRRVLRPWLVVVVSLAVVAGLSSRDFSLDSGLPGQPLWLGFPLLLVQAAAICAAALAGTGVRSQLSGSSFGWRQPLGVLVVVAAVLSPVLGLGWWVGSGDHTPIDRRPTTAVPTYMTDAAQADPDHGVLVVRGSRRAGFGYAIERGEGVRLGDDTVAPTVAAQQSTTDLIAGLATAADAADIAALADRGVQFIYLPAPADTQLVGNLDSVSGLASASAIRPGSRAWQLEATPTDRALPKPAGSTRPWLLLVQGLAILGAAVLSAPGRKVRR